MDLDVARQRLLAERDRAQALVAELNEELGTTENDSTGELADYDQHNADTGSETFEREKDSSIREGLEYQLDEIDAALARVDAGTYGVDEETGEPIPDDRLDAVPWARTNVR
jgi:RNA polymerase-binding transcription factor DksA